MKRAALKRWIPFRLSALIAPLMSAWPRRSRTAFLAFTLAWAGAASAASLTWDANGNVAPDPDGGTGTWDVNVTANWWNGAASVVWPALGGTNDDAVFGNNAGTVSIAAGGVTANDLTFNTTGYLIQSNTLTLNGTTPTITTGTGVSATISSVVAGSAGLNKAGAGTLILSGANTYTGGTSINGGTLQLGNGAVNGTVSGAYFIGSGSTMYVNNLTAVQALNNGWASQITGAGTLRLNSAQTVTGIANWGPNAAASVAFNPNFIGALQVDNGRMDSTPLSLGGISNIVINPNGQFMAWSGTYGQSFSLAGDGWGEGGQLGALRVASGNNAAFNGPITLTGNAGFNSQDGNTVMTINGAISGGFNFAKHNAGLLTLTGANTYTGTTTVNGGTLNFANPQSFYNGNTGMWTDTNLIVNAGGTASFRVGGPGEFTLANIDTFKGLGTATGGFKSGSMIGIDTTNAGGSLTYSSVIANNNGGANALGFGKVGTGTLVLTGANTYTGPTSIGAGGTLEVTGSGTLGSGTYAGVLSGGGNFLKSSPGTLVLTGANTLSGLTTIANGSIELGNGTIQAAPTGVYNIQSGTTLKVIYNTATGSVAQTWPRYTGSGTLTLATGKTFDTGWGTVNLPFNFNGTVRVEGGRIQTLATSAPNNMGFGNTQNVIVTPGGHVGMWEGGIFNQNYTLSGTGYGEGGFESAVRFGNPGNTSTIMGTVTLAGNTTLGAGGGTGVIRQGLGENTASNLTIGTTSQSGTISLQGASSYTGTTTVNFGTLELAGAGTLAGGNYSPAVTVASGATLRFASSAAQTLSGAIGGAGALVANGPGTLTLTGANGYSGATTVGGGSLALNYDTANSTKLADAAVLNLNGGSLTLAGNTGSHVELVGSTTLGGAATINRSGTNTAQIALGAITRATGGALEVAGTGIATTTTPNSASGVLPGVTLAGGLAMNDGANNIVAWSGAYADVNRLGGSIADGATNHVRIIEAGASGNISLGGAGTNTIATLSNTSTGGLATVDIATGRTLRLDTAGSILSSTTSGGLTVSGAGTLTAGGADNIAGDLLVRNQSSSATSISSIIANNGTGVVSLTKSGNGPLSLTGVNTFTGGVKVNGGTLTAQISTTQNSLGTGATVVGAGSTLTLNNTNTTGTAVSVANALSGNGALNLLFADGTTNARNTSLTGLANFTGSMRTSLAPGATATGDKFTSGTLTTAASLLVDPGTQLYVNGVTNIHGGVTISGTGNSESRGALRLQSTLNTNLTLAGDTAIGTEGGTLSGNIFSGAAGTQTLTFGTTSSTGAATINAPIGGGIGNIAVVKNQAGIVTLRAPSTYSGGTTINAGTLSLGSGGTATQTASETALGTGPVTVNSGATLRLWLKNDAAYTIGNNLTVNGGIVRNEDGNHTLSGTVAVGSLGATLTSAFDGKNMTLSNVVSGSGPVTVTTANAAATRVVLTAANTYTGATAVNSGTLNLSGAGSILSTSGITVGSGATLRLDNTVAAAANSGDRLAGGTPIALNGGTFNFAHPAEAANYSEVAGPLTIGLANTGSSVTASQAGPGQTSALTFASLTRTVGTTVDFAGTGLGADTRNRILFTASPLVDGIIGPWATVNGNLATYDNTLGVREFTGYSDVVRLTGSKVIADGVSSHVRIIEGTGSAANLTLGGAVTNVGTITQSAVGGISAATVDLNGQTLRLGVAGGVRSLAGTGALTIGLAANPGVLTAGGGTANTAGRISFINPSASTITVNSAITNNGTGTVSVESLSGNLTFGGGTSNTFNGTLDISTFGSANTRSVTFAKTGGATAIGDNAVVNFGLGTTGEANLRMSASGQFGNNVLMNFANPNGAWARFDLMGTNQSLAGITTPTLAALQHGAVIQNREVGNSTANRGTSTLTLTGSGNYQYNGYVRDSDTGTTSATNMLALTKSGSGTQTLAGSQIAYTGPTTVTAGTLKLTDTTTFNSPITNSATVEFNALTVATASRTGAALAGSGIYNKTGPGIFRINGGQTITATGQFNVQAGTLQNDNNAVNWSGNKADVDISSGAILDLYADPIFLDTLTGSGFVQNNYGNATGQSGTNAFFEKLVIGTNDGSGTFSGIIRNNSAGTAPAAATAGGGVQLEKVGLGIQTLSGVNTYTGSTLVSAGELRVNGSIAASSSVTVNAGAKLSGSGIVSTVSFAGGSILSPGNSPGILNTGSATSAADVVMEIGGPTAGNGTGFHDQVNTTGTLTLNGGLLNVSLINGYVPNRNDTFDIWLNDGADAILGTGTFTGLPEGATFSVPETTGGILDNDYWMITYAGNTGNDIRLTYVPEPGTSSLALIAGALALNRRRRRSR